MRASMSWARPRRFRRGMSAPGKYEEPETLQTEAGSSIGHNGPGCPSALSEKRDRYGRDVAAPSTIAELLTSGYGLLAHCTSCDRFSDLDVLGLPLRLGEEFAVSKLDDRLICAECGAK